MLASSTSAFFLANLCSMARLMASWGRPKSSLSRPSVTMFLARVVPADSLASSMKGILTQVASGPAPRSAGSTSVSSLASDRMMALDAVVISPLNRAKSFQLKTTRTST